MAGPRDFDRLAAQIVREVSRDKYAMADIVVVESQIGIMTGAVSGKNHVPGPVDGYPNADTHVLADSHEISQPAPLVARITVDAPYAAAVHDGTSRMGARPFLQLARDATRADVRRKMALSVNRAIRGLMVYSFARIGAALAIRQDNVFVQNRRLWVRLHEEGGKRHEMPCHNQLEEYLNTYIDGCDLTDPREPLLRTSRRHNQSQFDQDHPALRSPKG